MIAALWDRLPPVARRFGKFLVVGVVNTLVGYLLYAFFLMIVGLQPHLALTVSFWLGVLWNYFSTARFVFGSRGFWRLPGYVACYLAVYLINLAALRRALEAGWHPLLAQAVLTPLAAVLTFVLVSFVLTYRATPAVRR